ncbi:MAG: hypothetical protein R3B49_08725 [Phycisphaerales bacterium]
MSWRNAVIRCRAYLVARPSPRSPIRSRACDAARPSDSITRHRAVSSMSPGWAIAGAHVPSASRVSSHHLAIASEIATSSASICPSSESTKSQYRRRWYSVTMESPNPASALFASFHSGRCVFIQIPPPGTKFATLASAVTSSFSSNVTRQGSPFSSGTRRPSAPTSPARSRTRWSCSRSNRIDPFGLRTSASNGRMWYGTSAYEKIARVSIRSSVPGSVSRHCSSRRSRYTTW